MKTEFDMVNDDLDKAADKFRELIKVFLKK